MSLIGVSLTRGLNHNSDSAPRCYISPDPSADTLHLLSPPYHHLPTHPIPLAKLLCSLLLLLFFTMASYHYQHATAYVYTYDAATGALTSQLMRVPGGCHSSSSHRAQRSPSPNPLEPLPTLGKDTKGLIDEVIIRRGEAVYFIEQKAGQAPTTINESEKENVSVEGRKTGSAVRRVMREVREVELMARRLEEALCMDEEAEDDDDDDDDDDDEDEDDDDEDESDDEDDEDEDDDESDYEEEESMISEAEASLFGGSDEEDEEVASVEVSVVDGLCAEVESESDDEDEEGEWETVTEVVKERAMALLGDEDDWEAALFGGTEKFERELLDGMNASLARIKAAAETG